MVLPRQPCGPTPGSTTPLKQQKISSYFLSPSGVTVPVVCKPVIRSINFEKTEIGNIPGGVSPSGKTSETLASVGSKGNYFLFLIRFLALIIFVLRRPVANDHVWPLAKKFERA
jgi:hypothetical protein